MLENVITFVFCAVILIATVVVISLEYYYRKTKVSAVSSLPWMRKAVSKVLKDQLALRKHEGAPVIYELGSGWGPLAIDATRAAPKAKVIGIEYSPIPYRFSQARGKLFGHKNLEFRRADFFDCDFGDADVILLYMLESILVKLKPKFEAELKPGTIIISNTFQIEGWEPVHVETVMDKVVKLKVYVYRVPESIPQ